MRVGESEISRIGMNDTEANEGYPKEQVIMPCPHVVYVFH